MSDGTIFDESKREFIEKKYGDKWQRSIPAFNRGRKAFEGEQIQNNIREMLNTADFITVTTDYLKEYYHNIYDVPLDNIIAVPNFLPKYLFGEKYNPEKKLKQFNENKAKPRIGLVSSLSHFNIDNVRITKDKKYTCREEKMPDGTTVWKDEIGNIIPVEDTEIITDDFDEISETVRETVKDFHWVFFGFCPPKVEDLVRENKASYISGVSIMNYPMLFSTLGLQAVVAPIKKTAFNFCKSYIKTMECAALGIPLYATNCLPYNRVMPREQLFDTGTELKDKLLKLKFSSSKIYKDKIEQQWKWLNSPQHEGNFNIKNYWLEDNLNIHIDLFRMRQKRSI